MGEEIRRHQGGIYKIQPGGAGLKEGAVIST
jgi:hypothetical protein